MTKKFTELLEEMMESCDTQQLAVAECLQTVAENGDDQEEDDFLIGCAEEIRDAAQYVIDTMSKKGKKK
jgi:hypothetical protein